MKRIVQAGEFKAKCLKMMDEVQTTHIPLLITKRGKTVAKLLPYDDQDVALFGMLKGTAKAKDDLIKPIDEAWDAYS